MQLIDSPGAVSALPQPTTTNISPGYFAQVSATGGALTPTVVSADFLNMIMMEIANVITITGATLSKTNYTQLRDAINAQITRSARTKLTQNQQLFVATTGSDTLNTGLTSNSPFQTIQRAIDVAYHNYDYNGYQCQISIADGTYNQPVGVFGMPVGHSTSPVSFTGNIASPGNVLIYTPTGNAWTNNIGAWTIISGVTLSAGGTSTAFAGLGYGLVCGTGTYTQVHNCGFASCSASQIMACNGGIVNFDFLPSSFSGTSLTGLYAQSGGLVWVSNSQLTMNSPTYTAAFVSVYDCGSVQFGAGNTFPGSGSVTGRSAIAQLNGVVSLQGATLPGTSALTVTGGIVA